MPRAMVCFAAVLCPLVATHSVAGQTAAAVQAPTVIFQFDYPQGQPSHFTLTLHDDGTGHFHSDPAGAPPAGTSDLPSEGQDRSIQLSAATTRRIFDTARAKKLFATLCDGGGKVAFTGKKELSYTGPEGHGSCQYNYSHDAQIQWITAEMQAIAATLEEGRRLDLEHEHGRLGLDAELEVLAGMVKNGQAAELTNIAPTLTAIVQDEGVLERAQRRARLLLQYAAEADQPKH